MTARYAPHPVLPRYYGRPDERQSFVTDLFDGAARHYDRVCGLMSLGSGQWYRRSALARAGLRPGMTVLDVATGTGLVASAAVDLVGDPRSVVGLDPSAGMLREARRRFAGALVQGRAEALPFAAGAFDLVTIGYALRHVADLGQAFAECRRVLRPGGRLLVLEISHPPSPARRQAIRLYFTAVLPLLVGLSTRNRHARLLLRYYWDTIAACVPPETILDALRGTGFAGAERRLLAGCFSEYAAVAPARA
ncbi:MAG TPA: class I SAM-dependent methyltransferase [Candidatus Tectomicrobia bacterium]|nr:class I SAM-dependent methyltransferase [Candidatus Tectomicrobia bacterium]